VAAPVSFARGNGAAAVSGGYWENFYFFNPFLLNILIIIAPEKKSNLTIFYRCGQMRVALHSISIGCC